MSNTLTYKPTTSFPFVYYRNKKSVVSIDDINIFNSEKTCIVDSILISNSSPNEAKIDLYCQTGELQVYLLKRFSLENGGRFEFLNESVFYLSPEDHLHAVLGDASSTVSIVISYRELNNQK